MDQKNVHFVDDLMQWSRDIWITKIFNLCQTIGGLFQTITRYFIVYMVCSRINVYGPLSTSLPMGNNIEKPE